MLDHIHPALILIFLCLVMAGGGLGGVLSPHIKDKFWWRLWAMVWISPVILVGLIAIPLAWPA